MPQKPQSTLYIGTSNIVLPGNKSTFPEEFKNKSRLNYYSSLFNSVEINSSFYKIPMESTCEKWAKDVVDNFKFTLKFWKGITHAKELNVNAGDIESFLKKTTLFGNKKGCLLLQFPSKVTLEYFNKVEHILSLTSKCEFGSGWHKAVEFRHPSWQTGEAFELLDEYYASMVLHDNPKAKNEQLNKKSGIIYLRFHGPRGDWKGSYSPEYLKEKTVQIKHWIKKGLDVYAYFNNTAGDAFCNAATLHELNVASYK
jgi:uncharacterized protein YecE (DUF72 family)